MAAAKTHDFEIRAAIVRELLRHGVPPRDMRHEITLDSNGSGGRADIVAMLSDTVLAGIEIKSASDNLAQCVEQLDAYERAFDAPLFVIEARLAQRLERPERERVRRCPVSSSGDLWPATPATRASAAPVDGMGRRLWGNEIETLLGRETSRAAGRSGFGRRSRWTTCGRASSPHCAGES
jgi:hypothetical protein